MEESFKFEVSSFKERCPELKAGSPNPVFAGILGPEIRTLKTEIPLQPPGAGTRPTSRHPCTLKLKT
jgi:hypothetical protein